LTPSGEELQFSATILRAYVIEMYEAFFVGVSLIQNLKNSILIIQLNMMADRELKTISVKHMMALFLHHI
jgi:hypothetical protein